MQWIERFILHFRHIKGLVIILLVIVFYGGLKYCPLFQKWGSGTISMFSKANPILWHTVPLERCISHKHNDAQNICIYDNPTPNADCTVVQVSRADIWKLNHWKKWWETMVFLLFFPVVCSKVPMKRSYGNKIM